MLNSDIVLKVDNFSHDDQQSLHHRKTGKNRSSDKVGRENRRVPARND